MENSHRITKQIKPVGQIKKFSRGRSNFWQNEIWFLLLNWFVAFLCAEYNKQLVTKGQLICMKIKTTKLQDSLNSVAKLASFRSCSSEPGEMLHLILVPSWPTMCDIFPQNLNALAAPVKVGGGCDGFRYLLSCICHSELALRNLAKCLTDNGWHFSRSLWCMIVVSMLSGCICHLERCSGTY